jgi:hypothetical protein
MFQRNWLALFALNINADFHKRLIDDNKLFFEPDMAWYLMFGFGIGMDKIQITFFHHIKNLETLFAW